MIGYKATYNGKCKNILYEVGQTYILKGELVMCIRGFHFCQDLIDVFRYYPPNKDIKVFKVEALGNIETEYNKSVTDKIKILEEVDLSNLIVERNGEKKYFDDKGNLIKQECSSGYWEKFEYDSNNNRIKEVNANGFLIEWKYDENSNLIRKECSDCSWVKYEYNENNKCIKEEHSNSFWIKYEYDSNNNTIKYEDSYDYCVKYEYDFNNNKIKCVDSNGFWRKYEYDSNNNFIEEKCGQGQSI